MGKLAVAANQRQVFNECGGNDHPVEWVAVVHRKSEQSICMPRLEGDHRQAEILYRLLHECFRPVDLRACFRAISRMEVELRSSSLSRLARRDCTLLENCTPVAAMKRTCVSRRTRTA